MQSKVVKVAELQAVFTEKVFNLDLFLLLVVDRHKLAVFYLKSFDMDSVQVGKAVFGKEIYTTLGIEPRTYS